MEPNSAVRQQTKNFERVQLKQCYLWKLKQQYVSIVRLTQRNLEVGREIQGAELGGGKDDTEELGREVDAAEVLVSWTSDADAIGGITVAVLGGGREDTEELVKVTGVVELDSSSSSLSISLARISFS